MTAPSIVQTKRIDAAFPGGPERGHPAERDWLELLAELFAHPPTTLPCERIARLLCSTFRSTACSYSRIVDDTVVDGMIWSLGEEVTDPRRVDTGCRPDVASDAVGTVALRAWNEFGPR